MKEPAPTTRHETASVTREELEQFLQALTHEIRNRLSGISLEAADLAEQVGSQVDASRLQQQVQECSIFLKKVRELVGSTEMTTEKIALADVVKKLKERSL